VRSASRVSAGIAAATGGVIAAQELSLAGVLAVPFELAAETALVVLVELKLIAELHQVAGCPLDGGPRQRSTAAITTWLSGHPGPSAAGPLGRAGRRELVAAVRRRFTRNLATLGPLLTGAAAAGYLNRRETLSIGTRVARDLGLRR
jgi:hypothetical protein